MPFVIHFPGDRRVAELMPGQLRIASQQDGMDLLGEVYFSGHDRLLLHAESFDPAFFDLKTGLAGELLQKFTNYRIRLAIVGDWAAYASRSLQAFITESNRGRQICFAASAAEALQTLRTS
ncbi:MAG: DUF4180 domain-containing protein [Bacteroidia bacterium]|nr:DUF4180 domain-containing protein [Bacteroidia bacterium]